MRKCMNKNDCFKLKITDMGVDGEGIGKYDGMTFFVKDALIGDEILARALKLKKNYGYARVEEILTPSPYRVEPKCPIHRQCGGCQIQALSYEKQLEFKGEKVRNNLLRIGRFSEEELDQVMEPTVGMEEPYRYRNKAQFPVGKDKEGNLITGFYASRTHSIIPVTDCLLGVSENEEILLAVKNYMQKNHIEPYDEKTGKGLIRHVLIRFGFTTKEIMVCLIINGTKLPNQKELIDTLTKIDGMTSISFNVNTRNTNVILGDRTECIWGQSYITDYIHLREGKDFTITDTAIAYRISPQSFYQVNPEQTEKLYSLALEYAGLTGQESVWDLYCGIGTISLFLAQKAKQVYGVEIVPQAIEDARNNASINGITNAEFFVGKAEEVLPEFYESHKGKDDTMSRPDVIVVDPPRKGCDRLCLDTILKMQPARVVYVSCDSATLARDLRILCDGGYELKKVRPVDQFAHTGHVETCVLLSRKIDTPKIEITMSLDEADMRKNVGRATYQEIKDYVLVHHQTKVSSLYISQIKRKHGLEVGESSNKPKSEDARQPKCPPRKEEMIEEALRYFHMI